MDELKWEAYLINGCGGEKINIKDLTEEQRNRLDQLLNEQCAESVVIKPNASSGQKLDFSAD